MTAKWTEADLRALDLKLAEAGVRPHARPHWAAREILGPDFLMSPIGHPEADRITAAYHALFPHVADTWPGAGVGLAASGDDVRRLILGVAFGSPSPIETWQALGFLDAQVWQAWCRGDPAIAAQTALAFADLYDFASGLNALGRANKPAEDLWHMAGSNLADVANNLPTATGVDSIVQPVCLIAELSLKAALHCAGIEPKKKHDLPDLASKLADVRPHRDDTLIANALQHFPDYVESRYTAVGLSRLTVVRLALSAQFVAASSVRRFSPVDLALVMESDSWPGPRQPFLP